MSAPMSDIFQPDTALACTVRVSPNHGDRRGRAIDALVLHYTGMKSAAAALDRLCDAKAEVSSHYLVDEAGGLFQLVPEGRRAWHAGRSFWQGERDLNSISIGIEIANAGHDGGLPDFPDAQIEAVIQLCRDISARHGIAPPRVLAHSDIAPGRKVDPGPKFPWAKLSAAGVGIWPDGLPDEAKPSPEVLRETGPGREKAVLAAGAIGAPVAALREKLARLGFDVCAGNAFDVTCATVVGAFNLRYRFERPDSVADNKTLSALDVLLQK